MNFSRRNFLLMWITLQKPATTMNVEVLEVFQRAPGPCAVLVHHSGSELRQDFSTWLHRFDGAQIGLRTSDGRATPGRIFRVKMCFGRGLLLMPSAVNGEIFEKEFADLMAHDDLNARTRREFIPVKTAL